ncbi:low molecular weight protein tyrosine phosphatase family protein [Sphingopyxis fribergensis]
MAKVTNILFVCSQNKLRSPTAEQIFADHPGVETDSAGTNKDAENPLTSELVRWADMIFVMEKTHRNKLQKQYRAALGDARVICLDIPDDYEFMDEALIELLKVKVSRFLPM